MADRPPTIRLMLEYFGTGLWHDGGPDFGPIDLGSLGLSDALVQAIAEWQENFDTHAGTGDGWDSAEAEAWSDTAVPLLLQQLRVELGTDVAVRYHE